jgi:CHAT domain-containing protein
VKHLLSIIVFYVLVGTLSAQCPDKNFLWHRITYLRDSSKMPLADQRNELVGYLQQINNCPYKSDSVVALLYQRIGWLYSIDKNYSKAIMYTKLSLDVVYNNLNRPTVNYAHVIKTYNNLRILYDSCGQYRLASKAMDSCIAVGLKLRKGYDYALTLLPTKTYAYLQNGDYYKCIEYADLGERLCKTEPAYVSYQSFYTIWKFNSLVLLKKFNEAKQLLQAILPGYLKSGDTQFLGTFYALLANIFEEEANEKQTLFYINKSIFYNKQSKNLNVIADAWSNMGYVLYFKKLRNYNAALSCYKKALNYAVASESVNIYYNMAEVYAVQKKYDSASYFFQKAFDEIKPGITEKDLLAHTQEYVNSNMIEYIINLVLDKADLYLNRFKEERDKQFLVKAIDIYKTADQLFENIKRSQYDIESKLFWRQNLHRLYDRSIEACYLQNNATSAFYFFERSRAVLLSDQLSEHQWIGAGDILQQSLLKRKILEEEREMNSMEKTSNRYRELEGSVFNDKQQLDVLQDLIKSKIPFYYQNFMDSNFISIQDVRRDILKDHKALMEIFSGDSAVFLLTIDDSNTYFEKIDKNRFDSLSSTFSTYLSHPDLLNLNYNSFITASHQLYQLIFQNTKLAPGRIIISPDKNYWPFEALVTSTSPITYFLNDHAISYTYSARYLLNQFSTPTSSPNNFFLGVAPLNFSGLPSLAGSDVSLRKVQNNFAYSTSYIGTRATRNNFLNEFYKYKIIQLYTHATDSGQEGEPMIYFADSTLGLSELLPQEKPVSNLIVLSACQTASGKLYSGEGVFSFNRSFAALGIPSTVSNLWQTNDRATYRLTEFFYKHIAEGLPLDVALQKAKKELMETSEATEYRLPYFWASSILVGKTDAITLQTSFEWRWIAILLLASLLLIGWWKIKPKKIVK